MQEFTAKSSSLFTLCSETPINRAFQGVKSYQRLFTHSSPLGMPINTGDSERKVKSEEYFFVSLVKKRNKGIGEGCSRRTVH